MATEAVGIKAGVSIRKQTVDSAGKVQKTTFFFPDLNTSVEAVDAKEARELAETKAKHTN
jgi:hypothetical protein